MIAYGHQTQKFAVALGALRLAQTYTPFSVQPIPEGLPPFFEAGPLSSAPSKMTISGRMCIRQGSISSLALRFRSAIRLLRLWALNPTTKLAWSFSLLQKVLRWGSKELPLLLPLLENVLHEP